MKYYTEKNNKIFKFKKNRRRNMYLAIIIAILMLFNLFFYIFDKRMLPTIIDMAEIKMESEAVSIINEESVAVYSENFKYDDIIHIEKDEEGNISLMRADTVMQNYLASQVVLKCNDRFKKYESVGVKIPIGYLTNSSFFYNMGPSITVKMRQVGNINTSYESVFESAGINVDMKIRVIVPLKSRDVEVSCQIPVSDTIIVGKIPDTAINMNP